MKHNNTLNQLKFQDLGSKKVIASFNGGNISSDSGSLILRELEASNGFINDFSKCFTDYRNQDQIEHSLQELLSQRIFGICLGYEDLNDHDELRHDPLLATVCEKIDPTGMNRKQEQDKGKALAGKSTLNRLETAEDGDLSKQRYKKICYNAHLIENYFVYTFLKTYREIPEEIIIDVDATDDRIHGNQEGRYFHGYYGDYCYLPLYIYCGDYLLGAKLRPCNIDASEGTKEELERIIKIIRVKWPSVKIIIRGDSGFCREEIMAWCENNNVDYVFGLAKNNRLRKKIIKILKKARRKYYKTKQASRYFKDFKYRTLKSWSKSRRVIGKAEYLEKGENPRFIVTSLSKDYMKPQALYEKCYCARGEMENRIKEQQLYLFADRTSSATMRANQLRLWFSCLAYVILNELRQMVLKGTQFEKSNCDTIRLKLLKIGALVKISTRRIFISLSEAYPYKDFFIQAVSNLKRAYPLLC